MPETPDPRALAEALIRDHGLSVDYGTIDDHIADRHPHLGEAERDDLADKVEDELLIHADDLAALARGDRP